MSTPTPECACPYCARRIDAVSCLSAPTEVPEPGDITVCFYCGAALVFADGLTLRKPEPSDFVNLTFQFLCELVKTQTAIRRFHASKN